MNDHAVVLGAGIAGLVTATVLAEPYALVTVVERDRLPDNPVDRRGTPQGRHLHSLLSRGSQILEELHPGFLAELVEAGALVLDDPDMRRIYSRIGPYTFNRTDPASDPAALVTYLASRPFLESHLRRRVKAISNVAFLDGHDVGELVSAQPHRITGVTVSSRDSTSSKTLSADLIIDATGRATRTPLLLDRLGFPHPTVRTFTADGIYYSQQIEIPDQDSFAERMILVLPEGKAQRGGLIACENNTWTLTIAGRAGDLTDTPANFAGMLTLAQDFIPPHIRPALRGAHPLTAVQTYRYPGGTWRRYDQLAHHPQGLLVLGDALCSLDPINGQGMTMATLHATTLRDQLRRTNQIDPQAFYTTVAAITKPVWVSNAQQQSGRGNTSSSPISSRAAAWTRRKILEAAADNMNVTELLMRVANFIDPPQRLLAPRFLARVAAHHIKRSLTGHSRTPCPPPLTCQPTESTPVAITQEELIAGIAEIIEEVTGIEPAEVTIEKSFVDDLDIDSLSMVEIAVQTEDKYGVKIPDDDLASLRTVGDVVAYLQQLAEENPEAAEAILAQFDNAPNETPSPGDVSFHEQRQTSKRTVVGIREQTAP